MGSNPDYILKYFLLYSRFDQPRSLQTLRHCTKVGWIDFTVHYFEEIYQFFWRYGVSSKKVGRFFQFFVAFWALIAPWEGDENNETNWHIYLLDSALQCKMSDWVNSNTTET